MPKDKKDDDQYQRDCRNSEISGEDRKKDLDGFCENNDYVKAFYAKHTFEVDFLLEYNSHEIKVTVKKAYKQKKNIESIGSLIDNDNVAISGKEILRLAEKFGKGWFSIMISENINHLTYIPQYILEALIFACPNIKKSILIYIAKYRISQLVDVHIDKLNYSEISANLSAFDDETEALDYYKKELQNDVLSEIMVLIDA